MADDKRFVVVYKQGGFTNPGVTWLSDGRCVLTYWTTVYRPDGRMGGPISLKLATFKVK